VALHDPAPVRIDAGVRAGDAISPHYDPMIAKLIVWGADREQALARMRAALADTHIVGLASNVDFLTRLMHESSFARAQLDTGLIERNRATLFPERTQVPHEMLALAAARCIADEQAGAGADPWQSCHGWRLNTVYERTLTFKSDLGVHDVVVVYGRDGFVFEHGDLSAPLAIDAAAGTRLALRFDGRRLAADVVADGDDLHVFLDGRHLMLTRVDVIAHAGEDATEGRMTAPMPGKVIAVNVARGARVAKGAALLVMEAMKMEHTIVAPANGVVEDILYGVGDQVAEGAALVAFSADN
jgi:3-methylcrotonyl-CoA carboxylase alpha subunit